VALPWSGVIMIDSYRVAKHYAPVRRDELMLLPPDVREWLPRGHVVWFLLDVIERVDTSVLRRRAKLGGAGRAPYDPDMLLGVLVYAYACGQRSSRAIERRCRQDAAFMVLSGLCYPDHVTIARFRKDNAEVMDDLFDQVLVLCFRAGLGNLEHVAIDGTKIAANASVARMRDVSGLRGTGRRWLNEAAQVDDEEDARYGDARGDELPEELADPARRKQIIDELIGRAAADPDGKRGRARQRKARQGEQALALADELQTQAQVRADADLQVPIDALHRAQVALDKARAERQAALDDRARRQADAVARGDRRPSGRTVPVDEHVRVREQIARVQRHQQELARQRAAAVEVTGKRNLTDPDARFMPVRGGTFVLGYNAQLAVSADHLILDYDVVQDTGDANQLIPMFDSLDQTVTMLQQATGNPDLAIGVALLDAGYASEHNLTAAGPERIIALGKRANPAGDHPPTVEPGPDATATQKMAWLLSTTEGKQRYKKRGATVEPVNAHLKEQRGLRRFSQRGKPAAKAELALAAIATNLMRWYTTAGTTPTPTTA
jgi:transposase